MSSVPPYRASSSERFEMTISLQFPLVVEDGWPPVSSESLPFEERANGYESTIPPLFVSDLSVGDMITISLDESGFISSWSHNFKSSRSVVWLLRLSSTGSINIALDKLRVLGCNTVGSDALGCYSVDVPAHISIGSVDSILEKLNPDEVAVAFPSMRHPDPCGVTM